MRYWCCSILCVIDSNKDSFYPIQTQKDIPTPFFASSKPVHATVVIGSFGSAQGIIADAFDVEIKQDANTPPPAVSAPLRYAKQPQIHHIFKEQAKYPPTVIPLFFVGLILVTLPVAAYFVSSRSPPVSLRTVNLRTIVLTLLCCSGSSSSVPTSPTFPKLSRRLPSLIPPSSPPSLAWSLSTSCTTAACLWVTLFCP